MSTCDRRTSSRACTRSGPRTPPRPGTTGQKRTAWSCSRPCADPDRRSVRPAQRRAAFLSVKGRSRNGCRSADRGRMPLLGTSARRSISEPARLFSAIGLNDPQKGMKHGEIKLQSLDTPAHHCSPTSSSRRRSPGPPKASHRRGLFTVRDAAQELRHVHPLSGIADTSVLFFATAEDAEGQSAPARRRECSASRRIMGVEFASRQVACRTRRVFRDAWRRAHGWATFAALRLGRRHSCHRDAGSWRLISRHHRRYAARRGSR